jgi:thymidylate synthase (FAD)
MKVELISKTIGLGSYKELTSEEIVSAVARHGVVKEDNGKLIKYLMDNAHWSPLQHVSFGFKIETSRAISAQIFRHRSLHFQETSQRYQEIQEFEDVELRMEHPTNRQSSTEVFDKVINKNWEDWSLSDEVRAALDGALESYNLLIKHGVAKECARMILPMCSKTTIHVSGTLRDLLAFLNVRLDIHSQKEVRDIANAMGEALEKEMPGVFSNIDWKNGMFM